MNDARVKTVCGIIMPISHVDESHTAEHWANVRVILERAISNAGCTPKPVWESGDFEVIQGGILQNLYENEITVCDISTRNPNVMLEWGMRLTTKKPTIVVAEQGTALPFDINIVKAKFYDPKLDWSTASKFIEDLSGQITSTLEAVRSGVYKPYLEHFTFETVSPPTVSVTIEERFESFMEKMLFRLEGLQYAGEATNQVLAKIGALEQLIRLQNSNGIPWPSGSRHAGGLLDLAEPSVNVMPGDKAHHDKWGVGVVVSVDGNKIDLDFPEVGRKRVISSFLTKLPF